MQVPGVVHHGRFFSSLPPPGYYPTPGSTAPPTPPAPGTPRHSTPTPEAQKEVQPYLCLGFVIQDVVVYLSDTSYIPEDVWALFNRSSDDDARTPGPPVFVLDCLRLKPHTSHLGLAQSIEIARRMGAERTYLTGFGHEVSHDEYVTITEAVSGVNETKPQAVLTAVEKEGLAMVPKGDPVWVRPAFDGLRVFVSDDLKVYDEAYQ